MTVIELENICLTLRDNGVDRRILNNISLKIEEGEIYGLIGNNGAGKTSLLRIITGLTVSHQGKVRLFESEDLHQARRSIGIVMDSLTMDDGLSAIQYLRNIGFVCGDESGINYQELLEKVGLSDVGKKKISKFSLGMKRRLAIAAALVGKPKLLVMDEPFNGVDTNGMMEIRLLFQRLSAEGITILITSHIIPELMKLSTSYGIMFQGQLIQHYTNAEIDSISKNKLVMQTRNPALLIESIRREIGDFYCNSEANGQVTVYGNIDRYELESLTDCYDTSAGIKEIKMNSEDVLLWRMNGYEV